MFLKIILLILLLVSPLQAMEFQSPSLTGNVTADQKVILKSALATLSASEVKGKMIEVDGAYTMTLPAVSAGMNVCIQATAASVVTVTANASDSIILGATDGSNGGSVATAGAIGDKICLVASATANKWRSLGYSGVSVP